MDGLTVSLGLLPLLLRFAAGQDANCNFNYTLEAGRVYYLTSPGYSNSYPRGVQCRWMITCPLGYKCVIDCPEINMPESNQCSMDRMLVSQAGDPQLSSASYYCGKGSFSNVVSTGRTLGVGVIVSSNSVGGRFYCEVRARSSGSAPATCNCGYKRGNRIVGGVAAQPNEYVMMAGIAYEEQRLIRCGATIISSTHVLTAAHCVAKRNTSNIGVVVGEHDLNTGNDSPATAGYKVQSITVHPQYAATNYVNDIALVRVQGTIVFSEYVGPACLPFKYATATFTGSKVTMLGWGSLFIGGPTSSVLRKVDVDVISLSQCQQGVSSATSRQLCTYTPGKDACQDDSGGPCLFTDPATGRLMLVGIISFGSSCASNEPGVNTRVTSYLDFILQYTYDDYCRV